MLLVSYIQHYQQYFNTSITVQTKQVWKLLIALFNVPNTGAFTVAYKQNVCYIDLGALYIVYPLSFQSKKNGTVDWVHKRANWFHFILAFPSCNILMTDF